MVVFGRCLCCRGTRYIEGWVYPLSVGRLSDHTGKRCNSSVVCGGVWCAVHDASGVCECSLRYYAYEYRRGYLAEVSEIDLFSIFPCEYHTYSSAKNNVGPPT